MDIKDHRRLYQLYLEYLSEKDSEREDEFYGTARMAAQTFIRPFLNWIEGKIADQEPPFIDDDISF